MSTRITVVLDIDGDAEEAEECVDHVLDNGTFQDAIKEYADDTGREAEVLSAVITSVVDEHEPKKAKR